MVRSSLPRLSRHSAAPPVAAAVGLAMLATLLLGGCTPEAVAPTPIPVPPVPDSAWFASDEEALAAAHETYTAYLAAGDRARSKEQQAREEFFALSTGEAHRLEIEAARSYDEKGWQGVGTVTFDSLSLHSFGLLQTGKHEIRTTACLDISKTDVVDSEGISVAKLDRPLRMPLELAFQKELIDGPLLVSESKVWQGTNFC